MSERKSSIRWLELITAIGVLVAVISLWLSLKSTDKAVADLIETLDNQIEVLDNQNRLVFSQNAYRIFLADLMPGNDGGVSPRLSIAISGTGQVLGSFLRLEDAVVRHGTNIAEPEVENALLSFLSALRVDLLGEENAVSNDMLKHMLGLERRGSTR